LSKKRVCLRVVKGRIADDSQGCRVFSFLKKLVDSLGSEVFFSTSFCRGVVECELKDFFCGEGWLLIDILGVGLSLYFSCIRYIGCLKYSRIN